MATTRSLKGRESSRWSHRKLCFYGATGNNVAAQEGGKWVERNRRTGACLFLPAGSFLFSLIFLRRLLKRTQCALLSTFPKVKLPALQILEHSGSTDWVWRIRGQKFCGSVFLTIFLFLSSHGEIWAGISRITVFAVRNSWVKTL